MSLIKTSPSTGPQSPEVLGFYDPDTGSVQYLAICPETRRGAIIDAVLNLDPRHARLSTEAAEEILRVVERKDVAVDWILDTHPHADHVMASAFLKERLGAPTAIGARVEEIAALWRTIYGTPDAFDPATDFDRLLEPGDRLEIGALTLETMLSPGHTLGSLTYRIGDAAFVHDTLMHADVGSSRADFPGGSAAELWESIQTILSLPPETRLFVGHDYGGPDRKEPAWEATVAEHLERNPHVKAGATREEFIARREARDASLPLPDRMLYALQMNLRGGRLPPAEADGRSYFRIPAAYF